MRAVIQRVNRAAVSAEGRDVASIGPGLLVLLGIAEGDREQEAERLARKIRALRVFDDGEGRMSEPLGDREVLCVSQFTLHADTSRGNRPFFGSAAPPEQARPLYESFCEQAGALAGRFGARMEIELTADGPVTIILDSDA